VQASGNQLLSTVGRRYNPWQVLGEITRETFGQIITEREPIAAGDDIPVDVGLAHLAGRGLATMNDKATAALKAYLSGGGFLLAEAAAGDRNFDKSVRQVLAAAGLTLKPLGADSRVLSGRIGTSGQGFTVTAVGYTHALTAERIGKPQPLLFGIYLGDKVVGVYSPFDTTFAQTGCKAFDSLGYAAADARALAANIALLAAE